MKIETLKERIAKAEETISKKQNTITKKQNLIQKKNAQLLKAEGNEADWIRFDILNLCDDLERLYKEVAEKQESLKGYQEALQKELEKANSRNVEVILQFLENWKTNVKEFYQESLPKWIEARKAYHKANVDYCDEFNYGEWRRTGDKTRLDELNKIEQKAKAKFQSFSFLTPYIDHLQIDFEKLQKDLDYEANCKYDFIIERTNAIVGQITDASFLEIGEKGDLNGYIIGTRGKASVQTIGAGGWNVQCYHFRTLIHELKK